jgi:uncharacterized membrane protein YfcA
MKLVMLGIISGIVTGLGMGGGSILIILLTAFLGVEQHLAQATNLFFFIPTAIISIMVHFKNKNVDSCAGRSLLFPVVIGSALGALLTLQLKSQKLKKYFGIFLLAVGILEMIITIKKIIKRRKGNVK